MTTYDYIIAGAGSAGCVLADRLSEHPGTTVLLVEAGPVDRNMMFRIPKGAGKLFGNPRYMWHYSTVPFGPDRHVEQWMRGKTLGGSSSINGMIYNRGNRADYDNLEQLGNKGWGWDDILPIFRTIEDHQLGSSPTRGSGGPLHVSVPRDPDPLCEEMIEAAAGTGLSRVEDINATDDPRVGYATATIKDGVRVSAATAFLRTALSRPNLTLRTDTVVRQVLLENGRAVGLRLSGRRGVSEVRARREVILSLGSLNSPKLLQLSGIGPTEVLRRAGVPVLVDSENVGRGLREHRCITLRYDLNEDLGYNRQIAGPIAQMRSGIKYLATKRGPLAAPSFDIIGFVKTGPGEERVDGQLLMGPYTLPAYNVGAPVVIQRQAGLSCLGMVLRPTSQGRLEITSADPDAPAHIDPNYLGTEDDRRRAADLMRRMREIFEQAPIAGRLSHETYPGPHRRTDDELNDAALEGGYCGYHAVGTCGMGPGDRDVVDGQLRVRGVAGLRVVDCSVLPTIVAGNLNGPIMAMAWRAADFILDGR